MFKNVMLLLVIMLMAMGQAQAASKTYQLTEGAYFNSNPQLASHGVYFTSVDSLKRKRTLNYFDFSNGEIASIHSDAYANSVGYYVDTSFSDIDGYYSLPGLNGARRKDGVVCLNDGDQCINVTSSQEVINRTTLISLDFKKDGFYFTTQDLASVGSPNSELYSKSTKIYDFKPNVRQLKLVSKISNSPYRVNTTLAAYAVVEYGYDAGVFYFPVKEVLLVDNKDGSPYVRSTVSLKRPIHGLVAMSVYYEEYRQVSMVWEEVQVYGGNRLEDHSVYACQVVDNECNPMLLDHFSKPYDNDLAGRKVISTPFFYVYQNRNNNNGIKVVDKNGKVVFENKIAINNGSFDFKDLNDLVYVKNGQLFYQDIRHKKVGHAALRLNELEAAGPK